MNSKQIKYQSPSGEDQREVLVAFDKDGKGIKVYAHGQLRYESENLSTLEFEKSFSIEGFGDLRLHFQNEFTITVDGLLFIEDTFTDRSYKVSGVANIFAFLALHTSMSLADVIIIGSQFYEGNHYSFHLIFQASLTIIFIATYVLLRKGCYWFYFVGSAVFLAATTIACLNYERSFMEMKSAIFFCAQILLLALVVRLLPTIIALQKEPR